MALMAICRCISPLSVSEKIACTIWDGAARKSGLATNRRLISSQRVSPPRTDKTPAKLRSRVPCQTRATACASVASAGDATPCVETLMARVRSIRLDAHLRQALGVLPSPLWGGVGGGGPEIKAPVLLF